ncbi:MAG: ferritin-like domain-containing protein, partial [Phenylobacterium sp.]
AMYVDMDELAAEGERTVGDDIAEDGIRYLQAINFKDRSRAVSIAAE